jgi:predicted peroxiredoxin
MIFLKKKKEAKVKIKELKKEKVKMMMIIKMGVEVCLNPLLKILRNGLGEKDRQTIHNSCTFMLNDNE